MLERVGLLDVTLLHMCIVYSTISTIFQHESNKKYRLLGNMQQASLNILDKPQKNGQKLNHTLGEQFQLPTHLFLV